MSDGSSPVYLFRTFAMFAIWRINSNTDNFVNTSIKFALQKLGKRAGETDLRTE